MFLLPSVAKNGLRESLSAIPNPRHRASFVAGTNRSRTGSLLWGRTALFSSSSTSTEPDRKEHEGGKIEDESTKSKSNGVKKENDALQLFFQKRKAALGHEGRSFGPSSSSTSMSSLSSSFSWNSSSSRQPQQNPQNDRLRRNGTADNHNNGDVAGRRFDRRDDGSRASGHDDRRGNNSNHAYVNSYQFSEASSRNRPQQHSWERQWRPSTGRDQSSFGSPPETGNGTYRNKYNNPLDQGNKLRNGIPTSNNRNRNNLNSGPTSSIEASREPSKTYRIADLMQQLGVRKDLPPVGSKESSSLSSLLSSPSSPSSRSQLKDPLFPLLKSPGGNRDSSLSSPTSHRSSWRQRYDEQQQNEQQGGRFQRPRGGGGGNKSNNRNGHYALSDDFLQGRVSRNDMKDVHKGGLIDGNPVQTDQRKVVTLPNYKLTLTEVSALLRVKVDDIKSKLRGLGEGHILNVEQAGDVVDGDNETGKGRNKSNNRNRRSDNSAVLDVDLLELVAMEFGIETIRSPNEPVVVDTEQLLMQQRRSETETEVGNSMPSYPPRPPVVCIMGHVDHGKTTLMDALRRRAQDQQQKKSTGSNKGSRKKSDSGTKDIAGTEAGGITQIISAFQVALEGHDSRITFLDTPGHAAFRSMRQSGSHAADVIVLVIAADDGVSPQTVEILDFYKSIVKGSSDSGISMVVALNKIDKPGINVDEAKMRIENQLLEHGIISEGMNYTESEYGQPVQVIPTSGLTGLGLDDLMEGLLLQSEIMDLRADDESHAEGIVMDCRLEKGLGVVADCIIRWGKIEKNDVVVSGNQIARVRMLKDVNDKVLTKGLPSQPVRIIGFKSLPKAGEPLFVVESEEAAEAILEQRLALDTTGSDRPEGPRSDMELHIHGMRRRDTIRVRKVHDRAGIEASDGSVRIPIIVKADADGSLSAVRESLLHLGDESAHRVVIDPIAEGIGEVTISDIHMAKESEAAIFAFGLKRIDQSILNLAESENVTICSNDIIYSLLDEAKDILGSYLPPVAQERVHGRALIQAVFTIDTSSGKEKVAGLKVLDGHIYKAKAPNKGDSGRSSSSSNTDLTCHFRILRHGEQISPKDETVTASSLRRFKELVDSVRMGDECGLALLGFTDFEEGDEIECYSIEMKQGTL